MNDANRFEVDALLKPLSAADQQLRTFAESASAAGLEAREVLNTIPQMGPVSLSLNGVWHRAHACSGNAFPACDVTTYPAGSCVISH
jgi:hypothetical protein